MSEIEPKSLRWYRLRKFMKQEDLAKAVGVSVQTVRSWEAGKTTPSVGKMRLVAETLDLGAEELLEALDRTKKEAA